MGGASDVQLGRPVYLALTTMDSQRALSNLTITATLYKKNDGTFTPQLITFHDDGLNHDRHSNDGVYTSVLQPTAVGAWEIYFDGSDVGLTSASENIWGAEIVDSGDIYLTTTSTYAVPGLSGDGDDFFTCSPITLGATTACNFNLYWNGAAYGIGGEWLDALAITSTASAIMASYQQSTPDPADLLVENDSDDETEKVVVNEEMINYLYLPVVQAGETTD